MSLTRRTSSTPSEAAAMERTPVVWPHQVVPARPDRHDFPDARLWEDHGRVNGSLREAGGGLPEDEGRLPQVERLQVVGHVHYHRVWALAEYRPLDPRRA